MELKCKLELLKEKGAVIEYRRANDCAMYVECLDNDIRDRIYSKFENGTDTGSVYDYKEDDIYIYSDYYSHILIIVEKNKIKEYILNIIEDKEEAIVPMEYIWVFQEWLEKELNLNIKGIGYGKYKIIQLDIREKRKEDERNKKQKVMNFIDELF